MSAEVEPVCRCGAERIVSGSAVICPHCDRPCTDGALCVHCRCYARTCTDCRTVHFTEQRRAQCEVSHG